MGKYKREQYSKQLEQKFNEFQKKHGIQFNNHKLMMTAFTHSSYVNEHRKKPYEDNERLEFLGDAVLELSVSHYLFNKYPSMSEGEMTKLRAAIVCEPSLVIFANEMEFGNLILLGKGEEQTGGRMRPALLADVFEAFIGALYLDQGMEPVRQILDKVVFPKVDTGAFSHVMDYKSQLQEFIQRNHSGTLHYEILKEKGPAHNREFVSRVLLGDEDLGSGTGRSKKEAEQHAAQQALLYLKKSGSRENK